MTISDLPALNATFNSASFLLLVSGYLFIRRHRILEHKICMLGSLTCSTLFLISYLIYHYHIGSRGFTGLGWIRTVYFTILISHTILAVVIVPLVAVTLVRALRGRFEAHRRIARITLPLWIYVSVTGVIVYWMLYQL